MEISKDLLEGLVKKAIKEEKENWPLMEGDVYAIVDKFNEKKQDYDQVYFKDNDLNKVKKFEKDIIEKIKSEKPEIIDDIQSSGKLEEKTEKLLTEIIEDYKKGVK